MEQEQKEIGIGHFLLAVLVDGIQFAIGFLNLIPFVGSAIAISVSFFMTLIAFLMFGIFFGLWFPGVFTIESIPLINEILPTWTARMVYAATRAKVPAVAVISNKK